MGNIWNRSESSSCNTVERGHIVSGSGNTVAETLNILRSDHRQVLVSESQNNSTNPQLLRATGSFNQCHIVQQSNIYNQNPGEENSMTGSSVFSTKPYSDIKRGLEIQYKSEESWMYPLIFDKSVCFEQEDYFVPLELDYCNRTGDWVKKSHTNLEELFDPIFDGSNRVSRVLIRGSAGFGKSCLCQYFVFCWAHGKTVIRALPHEKIFPVFFKLRHLQKKDDPEERILEFIHEWHLKRDPIATKEMVKEFVTRFGENIVLVLDGYDKISPKQREKLNIFLNRQNSSIFQSASLLVTTRPGRDIDSLDFDKKYSISQLSEAQAADIVGRIFKNDFIKIQNFERKLEELCFEKGTNTSPLMVSMISWMMKNELHIEISEKCDFFYQLMFCLLRRCKERNNFPHTDEDMETLLYKIGVHFISNSDIRLENVRDGHATEDSRLLIESGILIHNMYGFYVAVHNQFRYALALRSYDKSNELWKRSSVEELITHLITDRFKFFENRKFKISVMFCNEIILTCFVQLGKQFFIWDRNKKHTLKILNIDPQRLGACSLRFNYTSDMDNLVDIRESIRSTLPNNVCLENWMGVLLRMLDRREIELVDLTFYFHTYTETCVNQMESFIASHSLLDVPEYIYYCQLVNSRTKPCHFLENESSEYLDYSKLTLNESFDYNFERQIYDCPYEHTFLRSERDSFAARIARCLLGTECNVMCPLCFFVTLSSYYSSHYLQFYDLENRIQYIIGDTECVNHKCISWNSNFTYSLSET